MTPKEKAEELILKYLRIDNDTKGWFHKGLSKQCALIAVDEIIKHLNDILVPNPFCQYWQEVKKEIEKL